jgi:hypothetical protein
MRGRAFQRSCLAFGKADVRQTPAGRLVLLADFGFLGKCAAGADAG